MPKTLLEILDTIKDGGRPDYDELRFALLVVEGLSILDSQALRRLGTEKQSGFVNNPHAQSKESFRRWKAALGKPPKDFLGQENDPDSAEYKARRRVHIALAKKLGLIEG